MSVVARDVRSTAEWLHAKLGSDDGWAAASISALLTAEVLQNISLCFEQLDLAVKIKVQRAVAVASPPHSHTKMPGRCSCRSCRSRS